MIKRLLPYVFHILLAAMTVMAAYFLLKPHYKITGLTIGLISMDRVLVQAKPFQQLGELESEANAKAQEHFQALEKNLRMEYDELQVMQQKKNVNSKDLAKRKANLDKKVAELEQQVRQEREALHAKFHQIRENIGAKLESIIREYHRKHKVDLFLNTSTDNQIVALVADDQLNHTDAIIALLNESISDIQKIGK
jgi:Skp family chaperone for outer membrane proteins